MQHRRERLQSIDAMRGLVIAIMALDHVRDFFSYTAYKATDVTQASVALFATRWLTHICAPTFVFLSGTGVYLYFKKVSDLRKTSIFLLTRGLWLIVVEIFVISFIITQGYQLTLLEVIWAIGCSMILLAAAVLALILGYTVLSSGHPTAAAVLLVLGYCVLFPLGIAL